MLWGMRQATVFTIFSKQVLTLVSIVLYFSNAIFHNFTSQAGSILG